MTFLVTGLIGISHTDAAVSPDEMEISNLIPAYEIILDGTRMGYVTDATPVQSIIVQVRQEAELQYGMDSFVSQELSIEETTITPDQLTPTDNMVQAVRND
ncbi:MAG: hypothetical protein PHG06_21715, partial [Parabacteroides sp.]|nr:hypothetical protein [Parabacteroides sp.]